MRDRIYNKLIQAIQENAPTKELEIYIGLGEFTEEEVRKAYQIALNKTV